MNLYESIWMSKNMDVCGWMHMNDDECQSTYKSAGYYRSIQVKKLKLNMFKKKNFKYIEMTQKSCQLIQVSLNDAAWLTKI